MIAVGRKYLFRVEEDCWTLNNHNGDTVEVLETKDCMGCWKVRCCRTGAVFTAYSDELYPIDYYWPKFGNDCSDEFVEPFWVPGDRAISMRTYGPIRHGCLYKVDVVTQNNTLILAEFSHQRQEWLPVKGEHDPKCFRRE